MPATPEKKCFQNQGKYLSMEELNPQDEKNLREAIRRNKMKGMLGELKALEEDLPEVNIPPASAKRRNLRPWMVAAGILFLLALSWYLFRDRPPNKYEELFAAYFEPYPSMVTRRGGETDLRNRAYTAYSDGKYRQALPLLEQVWEERQDTLSLFYLGIAQIADGETNEGIQNLKVFNELYKVFNQQVNWHIALGYLQEGEVEKFKAVPVDSIPNRYKKSFEEILQKLE